jgi:hypothetical protein
MDDETENLGPCCICETFENVRTIVMIDKRAPVAGHGWGCVVCGLATDGAVAVICDDCAELEQADTKLKFACRGYPASDGRVPIAELTQEFSHDETRHPELWNYAN